MTEGPLIGARATSINLDSRARLIVERRQKASRRSQSEVVRDLIVAADEDGRTALLDELRAENESLRLRVEDVLAAQETAKQELEAMRAVIEARAVDLGGALKPPRRGQAPALPWAVEHAPRVLAEVEAHAAAEARGEVPVEVSSRLLRESVTEAGSWARLLHILREEGEVRRAEAESRVGPEKVSAPRVRRAQERKGVLDSIRDDPSLHGLMRRCAAMEAAGDRDIPLPPAHLGALLRALGYAGGSWTKLVALVGAPAAEVAAVHIESEGI